MCPDCYAQCPNPQVGREKASKTMQLAKKQKFIADSSQGSCRILARGQRALSPRCYPHLQGVHKQLVAGLSRLVTCLQSNLIGPNLRGLFQLSPDRFPLSYQAHVDWLAPGGLIIMLSRKTRPTPNLGCLSWHQPWQPYTYKIIQQSAL